LKFRPLVHNIFLCLALLPVPPALAADSNAYDFNTKLGSGINFANALEAPKEGEWGVTLQPEYFRVIKNAGLQHVRVPIRWSGHALTVAPYTIDEKFFRRIDWVIERAQANSLLTVINMHHYEELENAPDVEKTRFINIWRQISQRYKNAPISVAFELYNEPAKNMSDANWNDLFAETLKVVRETNPHRIIIVGPAFWNNISHLTALKLPDGDRDLVVTCHYYEPFHFTHQGASWVGEESKSWLGTKWLDSPAERASIGNDLNKAYIWSASNHRPIYIGEFGAIDQADMESRARWARAVKEEATKLNFSTAYWGFCSNFAAYDVEKKQWQPSLLSAITGK
jgi:endoglucanase